MNRLYSKFITLFDPKIKPGKPDKSDIFYNSGNRMPFTKTTKVTQKRVDEILDKINQKGYHFLTDEEKYYIIALNNLAKSTLIGTSIALSVTMLS